MSRSRLGREDQDNLDAGQPNSGNQVCQNPVHTATVTVYNGCILFVSLSWWSVFCHTLCVAERDNWTVFVSQQSACGSAGLLRNLYLDLDALGGGLQYEVSVAEIQEVTQLFKVCLVYKI